jgi:hypothetical protein
MTFAAVINAFAIPDDARVDQRVPKKLLLEQGAPTAADKRQIQDGVEEITWVAALKPVNIGVPAFKDTVREYLEIAVLRLTLRATAKPSRLLELMHRAIPYPLVLVTERGDSVNLSLAHKRRSQGEAGKVVIENMRQVQLHPDNRDREEASFLKSLEVSRLPSRDLFALYEGLLERLAALEAARITGTFTPPVSEDHGLALRESVDTYARLKREIALLRGQASKEKQLNRRVVLNIEIKKLETKLDEVTTSLGTGVAHESH